MVRKSANSPESIFSRIEQQIDKRFTQIPISQLPELAHGHRLDAHPQLRSILGISFEDAYKLEGRQFTNPMEQISKPIVGVYEIEKDGNGVTQYPLSHSTEAFIELDILEYLFTDGKRRKQLFDILAKAQINQKFVSTEAAFINGDQVLPMKVYAAVRNHGNKNYLVMFGENILARMFVEQQIEHKNVERLLKNALIQLGAANIKILALETKLKTFSDKLSGIRHALRNLLVEALFESKGREAELYLTKALKQVVRLNLSESKNLIKPVFPLAILNQVIELKSGILEQLNKKRQELEGKTPIIFTHDLHEENLEGVKAMLDQDNFFIGISAVIDNAVQAMEESTEKKLMIQHEIKGKYLFIRFIDTGEGIPDGIQELIFEKGVTTKTVGPKQGSGIGLFDIRMTLEKIDGEIFVEETKLGKGTTMTMKIPIMKK